MLTRGHPHVFHRVPQEPPALSASEELAWVSTATFLNQSNSLYPPQIDDHILYLKHWRGPGLPGGNRETGSLFTLQDIADGLLVLLRTVAADQFSVSNSIRTDITGQMLLRSCSALPKIGHTYMSQVRREIRVRD